MARHIALLGDSILDNGAYIEGRPDVVTQLRGLLPSGTTATLLAVDGATSRGLERQVAKLPPDVDCAVVAVGGNDALQNADALDLPVASTADALRLLGQRTAAFESNYRAALADVVARVPQIVVCTIYNGNLPEGEAALARVGLALFNDVILRTAFEWHLAVIDLRLVSTDPSDYANPIEPSSTGGAKIARSIAAALGIGPEARASRVLGAVVAD